MNKVYKVISFLFIFTMFFSTVCYADNPIVQTIYTADPAPMVYNGTCYVYTGHDEDGSKYFTMNDWRCYSSTDMVNWLDCGSPLAYTAFSWAKGDAWAGQCISRNGKFYYYVPMTEKSGGRAIGVAVSDSPTGPFKDALGHRLVSTGTGDIDPTVFIDDDGQAYLYWGNPNLYYVKLNQDMISYSGSIVKVPLTVESFGVRNGDPSRATLYEEAPWFYKRNELYYMVYAAGGIPEYICYSTSTSPTGPWTYKGVIMPKQGGSFTNHPGIIDFKGNSYFFYHNGDLPGGGGFTRSVSVEKFQYNLNGTFPTINMTKTGVPSINDLNPYVKIEAETICFESGVETEKCSEGGMDVSNIENGDYIKVKGVNFGSGAVSFNARVASATNGGKIELRLDSLTGTLVGTCSVQGTGGWQTWVTESCNVSGATGLHDLYLKFTGGSGSLFNINYWQFTSGTTTYKLSDGWYSIKNVNATKYLQVANNIGKSTQNVEIGTGTGVDGQKWYLTNLADGYVTLKSALGEYMLDVNNAANTDGANIQIYNAYSNNAQKYSIKSSLTNGAYAIATMVSNETKVLDDYNAGTSDGTNVCQWTYTGGNNQLWVFEPTTKTTYKLGDLNKSGSIDIIDCIQLKELILNGYSDSNLLLADMNGDKKLNIIDYVQLKKLLNN